MTEDEALTKMIPPGGRRPVWRNGVLQVWITRACDKSCFGCTQGSNLGGKVRTMPLDQFETALLSLKSYFGVVGIFGGNPAILPNFEEYCTLVRKHVPYSQRGLWCNNPLGKGSIMRDTFNPLVSNLNVHQDQTAYDEFKRDWPESLPFGLDNDSRHSPCWVAMKDIVPDEEERWGLISDCDINKTWSALIGTFRGELRAWFCEIAGAQSMLHQDNLNYPDTGLDVVPDWWKRPMIDFSKQVRKHCHECSAPLRGYGELANATSGVEFVSVTHLDIYKPKRDREVLVVTNREQLKEQTLATMIDYIGNGKCS